MRQLLTYGLMLVLAAVLMLPGCKKKEGASTDPTGVTTPAATPAPAAEGVKLFFDHWKSGDFKKMYAQTANSSTNEDVFVKRMAATPVQWRDLKFLAAEGSGSDTTVSFTVEVTGVECLFAAMIVNAERQIRSHNELSFSLLPESLGIQQFMAVQQTWSVRKVNGKDVIDMGGAGAKERCGANVMNYVLDAGRLNRMPLDPIAMSLKGMQVKLLLAVSDWVIEAHKNLEATLDPEAFMTKVEPLLEKANRNLQSRKQDVKPADTPAPTDSPGDGEKVLRWTAEAILGDIQPAFMKGGNFEEEEDWARWQSFSKEERRARIESRLQLAATLKDRILPHVSSLAKPAR